MKIAVLVSIGRHPVSGVARYSRNDAAALTLARQLAKTQRATLDVLHAGAASSPALQEYLALGARCVEVLDVAPGADPVGALAARLHDYDLILTGTRAEGAFDSGMLPYRVAHALGLPLVGAAVDITLRERCAEVRQFMPKGVRRRVEVQLPALIAVHPLANAAPSYAYARLREGTIVRAAAHASAAANASSNAATSAASSATAATQPSNNPDDLAWTVRAASAKPVRLAAAEKRSGHARMLSATTTESRGGSVVIEGSCVEKAQVILAYLREHQLVDY
ncbi:electron transfer flavoprotein subunit beta/FixA family protein [Paraburkholderia sp. MMS20-SJTR3]|uniref:Electron transfer flavoprotein subunit beta/FixA family protein n=1 Tax=Paraburkholderia sejongensis TaxID=2886946 RepID=A0ABS8K4U8_9BURK|nr:electron transfer flavoprotein subunit beta/FixA family protein [Paraburkholderia sp. MMS20-SJTR3]MCC8396913.1 electron transfer flavoprotein subunit beta/FixA family protein [Paraburkholderia sp. MMS20-SJTR3]